jgi:hypothetical protein
MGSAGAAAVQHKRSDLVGYPAATPFRNRLAAPRPAMAGSRDGARPVIGTADSSFSFLNEPRLRRGPENSAGYRGGSHDGE